MKEKKLWGEFKNGHILNGRSKLRPTGLENRTHKFRALDISRYLFLPSTSSSLSLSPSRKGEHTQWVVTCSKPGQWEGKKRRAVGHIVEPRCTKKPSSHSVDIIYISLWTYNVDTLHVVHAAGHNVQAPQFWKRIDNWHKIHSVIKFLSNCFSSY